MSSLPQKVLVLSSTGAPPSDLSIKANNFSWLQQNKVNPKITFSHSVFLSLISVFLSLSFSIFLYLSLSFSIFLYLSLSFSLSVCLSFSGFLFSLSLPVFLSVSSTGAPSSDLYIKANNFSWLKQNRVILKLLYLSSILLFLSVCLSISHSVFLSISSTGAPSSDLYIKANNCNGLKQNNVNPKITLSP